MISTKGRYALRVMIDLAENENGAYIPLKEIAERQDISKKYLEIIVKDLVRAELVKGAIGKSGGYKLRKSPGDYTVYEILKATEGSLPSVACLADDAEVCERACQCKTLPLWKEYDLVIKDFFKSKRLSDLL